jgi:hypothetical protein
MVFFIDTDTDFSESEALSSLQISGPVKSPPPVHSEPEEGKYRVSANLLFLFLKPKMSRFLFFLY